MHGNVTKLVELLPPPEKPRFNRGHWGQVEFELGTRLPSDFMDFTEVYGVVEICDNLWFHTPFFYVGEDSYSPLLRGKERCRDLILSRLRQMDAVVGGREHVPFPNYPKPGGLLPIG